MATEIALTKAQRHSIISLKNIDDLAQRTQERLTTGRKVNQVIDDAVAYFQAKGLSDRSEDFAMKQSNIDQGISAMTTALEGIEAIDALLKQMKGLALNAKSGPPEMRASITKDFIEIGNQISELIEDTSYQGLNLINRTSNRLDISFSERTTSRLIFEGFDFNTTKVAPPGSILPMTAANSTYAMRGLFTTAAFDASLNMRGFSIVIDITNAGVWSVANLGTIPSTQSFGFSIIGTYNTAVAIVDRTVMILEKTINNLRAAASELGATVAVLQTRLSFTENYVEELNIGSDKLTLADLNEEGANLVALQTRQQIGLEALRVSGDQQQAILRLIQ